MSGGSPPEPVLADFLHAHGLAEKGDDGIWTPLAGGVSSDIWRVDAAGGTICVKRALPHLKVAADWEAPVERNAFEWAYMQVAGAIAPGSVPTPLAHDEPRGLFAMAWLDPADHRLWKTDLLAGRVDPGVAGAVGDLVARIHAATARDPAMPARFATDASFRALRIDPYLLATAAAHPDLARRIETVAATTADTHRALVHGDVSPKNIMVGGGGPVLLDAECAWFGDPAFDLAFCLNHLAIKARAVDGAEAEFVAAFETLTAAYLARVNWEPAAAVEARAAALLPVLALARVDGKSPVEYLDDAGRADLRSAARAAIIAAPARLGEARALLAA